MKICRCLFVLITSYLVFGAVQSARSQAYILAPNWVQPAITDNTNAFLFTNNTARGMTFNPVTGHILIASRNPTNGIHIMDQSGVELGSLDVTGVTGGTLGLSLISAASDGVIFAANLTTNASIVPFKLYRWSDESAAPTVLINGNPAAGDPSTGNAIARYGDSMDARGSGADTQILLGSRGTNIVLMTTADGLNFTSHILHTDIGSGDILAGLSFGEGNTFWTKAPSRPLRRMSFNLTDDTAVTLNNLTLPGLSSSSAPMAVDAGNQLLAILSYVNNASGNHTLSLYYIANPAEPVLMDTKDFPDSSGNLTYNNPNGVGSLDFGGGLLHVLEENNGIATFFEVDNGDIAPVIAKQPQSVTNTVGLSAVISVTVTNASRLTFQWRHNGVDIPNATEGALVFNNLQFSDAGNYNVVIANAYGFEISESATLTVDPLPSTIIVESRTTAGTTGGITPNPPYQEFPSGSWSGSSSHTTAGGVTPNIGSRYAFNATGPPSVTLNPRLEPGATYALEISHISPNASSNIVINVSYSGCTGTATSTRAFDNTNTSPAWERVGMITVNPDITRPFITFTYGSGFLASTLGRWYSDAYRFVNQSDPCVTALAQLTTVNGPLAAAQTFINVPAVAATATRVRVFADGVQIGQLATGVKAGVNRVTTTPLVKGQVITATQADSTGIDSCRPTTGPVVGGGANTHLRVSLSIRENTALTGPVGTNGGTTGSVLKFISATNTYLGAVNNAPQGGKLLTPGVCWQTVSFERAEDRVFGWNGQFGNTNLVGDYGVFESLGFSLDDTSDTGPYQILIDDIRNGPTLIQDFEGRTNATRGVLFTLPSFSGSTGPYLLSQAPGSISPDISQISQLASVSGSNSAMISWQFKDRSPANWLRLSTQGTGTPNPVVDLRYAITMRMLVLPVGSTNYNGGRGPVTVSQEGNIVRVSWPDQCRSVLEWANECRPEDWREVPDQVRQSPFEYDITTNLGQQKFFRLRQFVP